MKKTGLEIVEMIAKGEAPKKIKHNAVVYNFNNDTNAYEICAGKELIIMKCLNDEFEIIEEPKVWKPKEDEKYYFIDEFNDIDWRLKGSTSLDDFRYNIGNCYKAKEEAQKTLEKIKIYTQLKRYAEEHNTEKIDWKNFEQDKYHIVFNKNRKLLEIECINWTQDIGQIYFVDEELILEAIKEIGEENIKKLFEE